MQTFDIAVVGAGPSGLIVGLAASELGLDVAVVGPPADQGDTRTAALMDGSIQLLRRLGVWKGIEAAAAPLSAIRLVDACGGLFSAPEVTFQAEEIGLAAFGYNIPNAVLTAALEQAAATRLTRISSRAVTEISLLLDRVELTTAEGAIVSCRLAAAADGRQSPARAAAGITVSSWSYDQAAIVTTFAHSRGHDNISTEFHRPAGPLTIVPGPGQTSNLVWVETRAEAERIASLHDAEFARELSGHLCGLLGTLSAIAPRRTFRLQGQTADIMGRRRIALIGEAAHVMPPIGAQGLNLSFRDAAVLAELAAAAKSAGADPGSDQVLSAYEAKRRFDIRQRVWTVDLLNRSLISPYLPVSVARGAGLLALATIGPLRRYMMREGVGPSDVAPTLMRAAPA